MPLAEHQPYKIANCIHCPGEAIYCEDWDKIRWEKEDPDCIHEFDLDNIPKRIEVAQ